MVVSPPPGLGLQEPNPRFSPLGTPVRTTTTTATSSSSSSTTTTTMDNYHHHHHHHDRHNNNNNNNYYSNSSIKNNNDQPATTSAVAASPGLEQKHPDKLLFASSREQQLAARLRSVKLALAQQQVCFVSQPCAALRCAAALWLCGGRCGRRRRRVRPISSQSPLRCFVLSKQRKYPVAQCPHLFDLVGATGGKHHLSSRFLHASVGGWVVVGTTPRFGHEGYRGWRR